MLASCPGGWVQNGESVTCPSGFFLVTDDAASVIGSLTPEMAATYFAAGFAMYLSFWVISWPIKASLNFFIGLRK